MKTSSGPRSIQERLARLAIAATLAVGWFAMGRPAGAEIVYTPTNITVGPNGSYNLDVNNDGIIDFTISASAQGFGICCVSDPTGVVCTRYNATLSVDETPASGNDVVGSPPAALASGDQIGPSQTFRSGTGTLRSVSVKRSSPSRCQASTSYSGKWVTSSLQYLGLAFKIDGQTCYGWARLSVEVNPSTASATLTGYAYETIPGMAINAGQTSDGDGSSGLRPGPENRNHSSGIAASLINPAQAVNDRHDCSHCAGTPAAAKEGICNRSARRHLASVDGSGSRVARRQISFRVPVDKSPFHSLTPSLGKAGSATFC
jgi:hypothetical protein